MKNKGIYLWKLIIIILIIFSIVLLTECFFLIEKTVRKVIEGSFEKHTTSIIEELQSIEEPALENETNGEDSVDSSASEELSEEENEKILTMIQMIEELPSYEEVEENLNKFDELNDDNAYQAYFISVKEEALKVRSAYVEFINEYPDLGTYITNSEKLFKLSIIWEIDSVPENGVYEYNITRVNEINWSGNTGIILYGKETVYDAVNSQLQYWNAYIVEKQNNSYIITGEDTKHNSYKGYVQIPTDGFVLMIHIDGLSGPSLLNKVVELGFDYTKVKNGKVTISDKVTVGVQKEEKNNKLVPIKSVSTKDTIKIDLFNYTDGINTKNSADDRYPGFKSSGGPSSFSGGLKYNFAESIREDMKENTPKGNTGINDTSKGNSSIPNALAKKLVNGYPALMDGGKSIGYLFGEEKLSYVEKLNTTNIDGLFRYDETTKSYTFDSRKNYAKYENNEFKLYNELITPDFIQYPFGNFLPLNDIQTAQRVIDITPEYFEKIRQSAIYKENEETDSVFKTAYSNLANALKGFISEHTSEFGNSWNYENILRKYAKTLSYTKGYTEELYKNTNHFSNLYSIDYDDQKNFHFGMSMEFKFIESETGKTKTGEDIVYEFDGDDDVLIYIDNILFLELAGSHRQVGGKINFTEGKIYYFDFDTEKGDVSTDYTASNRNPNVQTFEEVIEEAGGGIELEATPEGGKRFKSNSIHKLKFFYLERGAGSSLCNMEFNMVLTPERCNVVGSKIWEGDEKYISSRPEEVTIDLYRDGTLYKTTTTNAEKDWKYEFKDLVYMEVDDNSTIHNYTVKERDVADYITVYEEDKENSTVDNKIINIKNYYMYKDIEVVKEWDDDIIEGKRQDVIVDLIASVNDKEIEITKIDSSRDDVEITLNGKNEWSYKWRKLEKYKDNDISQEIHYLVEEISKVNGYYQSSLVKDEKKGIIKLTNTKLRNITFTKVDKDNNEIFLEGAQFKLEKLNENDEIDTTFTPLESNVTSSDGKFSFKNLEYGKYVITEIKTPKAYNTLENPIYVELTKEKAIVTIKDVSKEIENTVNLDLGLIENKHGFILPVTGGERTAILYIILGISIINISVLIMPRKKKGKHAK